MPVRGLLDALGHGLGGGVLSGSHVGDGSRIAGFTDPLRAADRLGTADRRRWLIVDCSWPAGFTAPVVRTPGTAAPRQAGGALPAGPGR